MKWWSSISQSERRTVIIGGAILFAGLFYVRGVKPYRAAMSDARDQLDASRIALSREKAAVISAKTNPNAQRSADSALAMAVPRLFEGRDDAVASSQLAGYLGDAARRNRVLMEDASTRASTTTADGVRVLHVELRAESDIQGVVSFLQALETGSKLVRVDRLQVSRTPGLEEKGGFETLSIAATVSGFAFAVPKADSASAKPTKKVGTQ